MTREEHPTRRALLDAATELFSERGFADVGTREIADQAGVNLAAIKYHFGSKRDLYVEAVRCTMDNPAYNDLMKMFEERPNTQCEAAVLMGRMVREFFALFDHRLDACALMTIREALKPSEAFDDVIESHKRPFAESYREIVRTVAPHLNEFELAMTTSALWGQMFHFEIFLPMVSRLWEVDLADAAMLDELARMITEFSLRGLKCDEALIAKVMRVIWSPSGRTST
jgi:AcrR family transcriptional regulator